MSGCCGTGFQNFVYDTIFAVRVPRELVIQSNRLGILNKMLQATFAIFMLLYVISVEVWNDTSRPAPYAFSLWSREPNRTGVEPADQRYCKDLEAYASVGRSREFLPTSCRTLRPSEAYMKQGAALFVPFHNMDTTTMEASGPECSDERRAACEAGGAEWSLLNASEAGAGLAACSCRLREDYLVRDAELMQVAFWHGYEVQLSGERTMRGVSGSTDAEVYDGGQLRETKPMELVTVLQNIDGEPCYINDKSEYGAQDSADGISASIRDWLSCAKRVVDEVPEKAVGGPAAPLRIMGFRIVLSLHYSNSERLYPGKVVCFVNVLLQPTWTSTSTRSFSELSVPFGQHVMERYRRSFGALVDFEVGGQFKYFNLYTLVTNIVNTLFMLTLPREIIQIIILYGMGSISHIYRHAARTRFRIYDQVRTAVVRMLIPMMAFRCLNGGDFTTPLSEMPGLEKSRCLTHLKDAFAHELRCGTLEKRHLARMVGMIYKDSYGKLNCHQFSEYYMANEVIGFSEIVDIVHVNHKARFLERLLDSTRKEESTLSTEVEHDDTPIEALVGSVTTTVDVALEEGHGAGQPRRQHTNARGAEGQRQEEADGEESDDAEPEPAPERDEEALAEAERRVEELEGQLRGLSQALERAQERARAAEERAASAEELARNCLASLERAEGRVEHARTRAEEAEAMAQRTKDEVQASVYQSEALGGTMQVLAEQVTAKLGASTGASSR